MDYNNLFYTLLGALVAANVISRLIDKLESAYWNYLDRQDLERFMAEQDAILDRLETIKKPTRKKK